MSPLFSESQPSGDWSSMANTLRVSPSQSSQFSTDTQPEASTSKSDHLQHSLGVSWANYLGAQHHGRELSALRQTFSEQIRQVNASVTLLQQGLNHQQSLVTSTVDESRSQHNRITSDLSQLKPLLDRFSLLQREVSCEREQTAAALSGLEIKITTLKDSLDSSNSLASQDVKALQERYASALGTIESLQRELKEAQAEKMLSERRVSALERQMDEMTRKSQQLPQETVKFIGQLMLRQNELMGVLGAHSYGIPGVAEAESSGL